MANKRGQQRDKPFRDALRMEEALAAKGEETPAKPGSLRYIARQLLNRAGDDTTAAAQVGDRLDGKPAMSIDHSGEMDFTNWIVSNEPITDDDWARQYGNDGTAH